MSHLLSYALGRLIWKIKELRKARVMVPDVGNPFHPFIFLVGEVHKVNDNSLQWLVGEGWAGNPLQFVGTL